MDGHGPDAWQVTGVAPDDTLNVRTGPGPGHLVIGSFEPDASGLKMVTCVPFLTRRTYWNLTERQLDTLPPKWCLMEGPDLATSGWVSAQFLKEDSTSPRAQSDPLVDEARALVQNLYNARRLARRTGTTGPLHPSVARRYFFADGVTQLAQGVRADPLFGAQDAEVTNLEVAPAPDRAMFRGMVSVHATFRNFGLPQRAVFRLRIDDTLDPPALRVMRIEHEGWTFP